jgi:glycerol-3-phosphate dehydrogenase
LLGNHGATTSALEHGGKRSAIMDREDNDGNAVFSRQADRRRIHDLEVASEDLVKAYARLATERGANIVTHAKVERLEPSPESVRVFSTAGEIESRCLVNSAGLFADDIAAMLGSSLAKHRIYPVRGEYCELVRAKSDLIRALVYPLPDPDGLSLGAHLTKTLWGTVLVGPTARYVQDKNDYEHDRLPVEDFARMAKPMLPEITPADLVPAYSGIRAKLTPPGEKGLRDFVITRDPDIPCAIQLIGIDSPGLTSALAIAEHVTQLIADVLD